MEFMRSFPQKRQHAGIYKYPHAELVGLWCTRILLDLEGFKGLGTWGGTNGYTSSGSILKAMDLGHLEDEKISTSKFKAILAHQQNKLLASASVTRGKLPSNIRKLGKLLDFTETDQKILMFAVILHNHRGLEDTTDTLEYLTSEAVIHVLSVILDLPARAVRDSLDAKGILRRSGLLRLSKNGSDTLSNKLEPADGLADTLFRHHADVLSILDPYFHSPKPAELSAEQFPHLAEDIALLKTYLKTALKHQYPGSNILIYGPPGTGKTEFSKMLASLAGAQMYEISNQDEEGEPLGGGYRFRAFRLTQEALSHKKNSIILFDEIEDVFPTAPDALGVLHLLYGRSGNKKGWINHLLEENPVPAIWISNDVRQMDRAFIRRFDYVLKIALPPRKVRAEILRNALGKTRVSPQWIDAIADNRNLPPAVVAQAARLTAMTEQQNPEDAQTCMERVMGNTLKAMGYERMVIGRHGNAIPYRLEALNPDCDLKNLLRGLKRHRTGRICLYGPPGTGKTELGKYIARSLDKPLLVKRASDLLDMYVGGTERNIARMFEEAREEDAVLLLDEADSFLRDRKHARQSWEVTQVNELLTQMESHAGLFICSTNLMDELDDASTRRFDFKIKLDYMSTDQLASLFRQVLKDHGIPFRMTRQWRSKLSHHKNLAPGDFSTAVRKLQFSGEPMSAESLLDALIEESRFKQGGESRGIGFTARF